MEHPYLFFVKVFEWIGLGHFAHTYPHVIYSWVVMALLIGFGAAAASSGSGPAVVAVSVLVVQLLR